MSPCDTDGWKNSLAGYSSLRSPFLAFLMCLFGLTAVACGSRDDRRENRDATVVVAYPYEGGGDLLGPSDDEAMYLVFLPLLRYDEKGNLEGRLAKSWEHSADYHEWTYHLRTDVRWHDSTPVTAYDVAFTLELLSLPTSMEMWDDIIQSITVHDDSTITVRGGDPEYYQTEVVHYPSHLLTHLEASEMLDWPFWLKPVGNGPYRFVRYVPQTLMEFEANPDYVFGEPRVKRVVLKFVERAGLTELLGGNVDVVKWLDDPAQARQLANNPLFQIHYSFWGQRSRAIYWRCDHPILADLRVRRALDLGIDRRTLLRALTLPESVPAGSGFYSERQFRRGNAPTDAEYDPERARRLLEDAGWLDRDGDGIRERDGAPLRITALVNASERYDNTIAIYVRDQLGELGVDVQLQPIDGGALFERYKNGDFEAAIFQVWLQERFLQEDTPLAYHNPRLAELVDIVRFTADPVQVDRAYREVTRIFRTDVPISLLFPIVHTTVSHRRVRGLSSPWRSEPVWHMEDLWLQEP
jgi:peptide/nickel transport system substrate-binding protein